MRLGLSSIVGDGFGTGSFGIDGIIPTGAIVYYDTLYYEEYPIAQGGTYFVNPFDANNIPNQTCTVDRVTNGSTIWIDWTSVRDIAYKVAGLYYGTDYNQQNDYGNVEVPTGSGNYYSPSWGNPTFEHDGAGSWQYGADVFDEHKPNGTFIAIDSGGQTEVPSGSGNNYYNGSVNNYTWVGNGVNYTSVNDGAYYPNGAIDNIDVLDANTMVEVPTGSGNFYWNAEVVGYTWNGAGGYNYPVIKAPQYANGSDSLLTGLDVSSQTEIPTGSGNNYLNGLVTGYTWDGAGGYNYPVTKQNYSTSFVWGAETVTGTGGTQVEVPAGSGNYFDSEQTGTGYFHDGAGGYTTVSSWLYQSGSFIYNDGNYNYYWNGVGGYYY
jgi:hypothetical protein